MAIAVIVDENMEELQASLSLLKSMGQFEQIYGFNCPDDAYCLIKEKGCDVLFTETEVKGMNCFVLISKVRKINKDILCNIMTLDEGYAYEAFQKGVDEYVIKPLTPEAVTKMLEKLKRFGGQKAFG